MIYTKAMATINTDPKKIEEVLTRGVHEVYTREELKQKLLSGKQLHLKLGIDVTGPMITLGHSVIQRKLRDFQELGHKVTLIIGDFTTLVGDHSDKVDMRSETNEETIKENEKTYKEQFFKTVLEEQTEIRHNSEWLKPLNFNDVIGLAKQFTIAQMLDRETFKLRYEQEKPIGLDEFLYPLMQGYDSVALECDVELGGTDQTFNLLAGRKIMENMAMRPQSCMAMRLLTGNDGKPMGKSLKNYIPVNAEANDMYGKLMSIVDEIIWEYFELVTRIPMEEVTKMKVEVENGSMNPMDAKKKLAWDVTAFYHGENKADEAAEYFKQTVQEGNVASDAKEVKVGAEKTTILEILKNNTEESSGELKRRIQQGGVEINETKVTDINEEFEFSEGDVIKYGKRQYLRIIK